MKIIPVITFYRVNCYERQGDQHFSYADDGLADDDIVASKKTVVLESQVKCKSVSLFWHRLFYICHIYNLIFSIEFTKITDLKKNAGHKIKLFRFNYIQNLK